MKSTSPISGRPLSRRNFLTAAAVGVSAASAATLVGATANAPGAPAAGRYSIVRDRRFEVIARHPSPLIVGQVVPLTLRYTAGPAGFAAGGGGHLWVMFDIRQWSATAGAMKNEFLRATGPAGSAFDLAFVREGNPVRTFDLLPAVPEFTFCFQLTNRGRALQPGEAIEIDLRTHADGFFLPENSIDAYVFWLIDDPSGRLSFEKTQYAPEISQGFGNGADKYTQFQPESEPIHILEANPLRIEPGPAVKVQVVATPIGEGRTVALNLCPFDRHGNPVVHPVAEILIEGGDRRLAIPGPIAPGQRLHLPAPVEPAIYTVSTPGALPVRSNPVRTVRNAERKRLYFGDIHGMAFNHRPYEDYHFWGRDVAALDFSAGLMFSYNTVIGDYWERHKEVLERFNEPGRYVSLPAVECGTQPDGSHRNIYFPEPRAVPPIFCENRAAARDERLRKRFHPHTVHCEHYRELYQVVRGYGGLIAGHYHTLSYEDEDLMEVYQKAQFSTEAEEARINKFLMGGMRAGIVSGTDTHDSRPGNPHPEAHVPRPGGLTGVWADQLDRKSIFEALKARRCFATTGHRPVIEFAIGGKPMGSEAAWTGRERLTIDLHGTARLTSVELVVNGLVKHAFEIASDRLRVDAPLADVCPVPRGHYCYLRIKQEDNQQAWTSPIWLV